jgi:hypothetical protein
MIEEVRLAGLKWLKLLLGLFLSRADKAVPML